MGSVPSATWQMLDERISSKPLPRGLDAAWDAGSGMVGRLVPRRKKFLRRSERIVGLEKEFSELADSKLRLKAGELREIFRCRRDSVADVDSVIADHLL